MSEKSLEVENYEHNLTIHHELKRKELDTLLTTSMPAQLANIKTILWFNIVMLLLFFKAFETTKVDMLYKGYLVIIGTTLLIAVSAMLIGREKDYGAPEEMNLASKYIDNEWTKSQFLIDMLNTTQTSIEFNRTMVTKRAKLMNLATFFTLISTIYFLILIFERIQHE
jgi:hypothetical protein